MSAQNDFYLAVYLSPSNEAHFGVRLTDGEIYHTAFPVSDRSLPANLSHWLSEFGLELGYETCLGFVPLFYTEQTRVPVFEPDTLALGDDELVVWLVNAARESRNDADGYAIFDDTLANASYDFVRLAKNEISLTELPKKVLEATLREFFKLALFDTDEIKNLSLLGDEYAPELTYRVETHLRAIARFALAATDLAGGLPDADLTTVFFSSDIAGGGFAFYSPERGFYFEVGEVFHSEELNFESDDDRTAYIRDSVERLIHENLDKYLFPEKGEAIPIGAFVWSADADSRTAVGSLLGEYAEFRHIRISPVNSSRPQGEMITEGLLLSEADNILIPAINLAVGLENRASSVTKAIKIEAATTLLKDRRATVTSVFAPLAIVFALLLGLFIHFWLESLNLNRRASSALAEKARLQPILDSRRSYEQTLSFYQDIIRQISSLRNLQKLTPQFAARLDAMYPPDQTFYISELLVKPGGDFEIRGLTRSPDAVTAFVARLEYAGEMEDSKLFANLQIEFKQGSDVEDKNSASGNGLTAGNLNQGVSAFLVRGNYLPMQVLKVSVAPKIVPAPKPAPDAKNPASTTPAPPTGKPDGK